jgi:hypothetical protein
VGAVLGSVVLKRYEVQLISPVIILHSCLIHARDDSVLLEQTFVGVIPQHEQANRFGSAWPLLNGDLHTGLKVTWVFFELVFYLFFF